MPLICYIVNYILLYFHSDTDTADHAAMLTADEEIATMYRDIHDLMHSAINIKEAPLSAAIKRIQSKPNYKKLTSDAMRV